MNHNFNCHQCRHRASSNELLRQHIAVEHNRYVNLPNWFMVGDSHLNTVDNRMVEKATKGKLFCPGSIHPKEGRAYWSTRQWPNAKFPDNNHTEMVPRLLSQRPFKGGIILAPGNDISNLVNFSEAEQYSMAEQSALNMVKVAERALENNSTLEKIVLIEYPPRADNVDLAWATEHANQALRKTVDRSRFRQQIGVGNMNKLKFSNKDEMVARFGPQNRNPRYDGIHFRGRQGKHIYTESIIAAVRATSSPKNTAGQQYKYVSPRNTVRQRNQQGILPTPTYNKFETLSN